MGMKCGKRCAERGCQRPDLHPSNIRGNKWCPPCAQAISDGAYVHELCERCCLMPIPLAWEFDVSGSAT